MSNKTNYDVVVIGGGPGGSSTASALAGHGRNVLVLEKEKFPRYIVGESLMPYCWFPLERIGAVEKVKAVPFVKKYSVRFVTQTGKVSAPFYFFQHFKHDASTTWQVERSEFDHMLLNHAREKGAEVREETEVKEILTENGTAVGVRALDKDGNDFEIRSKVVVDASGRRALAISKNRWRRRDPELNKVAIWTYYKGALRDSGYDEGATTVAYLPEKGWFWYIPLQNDLVGVGVVAEKDYLYNNEKDPEAIFNREVQNNEWIKDHLAPGTRCEEFRVTGEFSYRSLHCASDGLVLVGDAFAFLDPVFSSGVFLALQSGVLAADVIHEAIADGDVSAGRFTAYGDKLAEGIEAMRKLVYAFYDKEFSFRNLLMKHPDLKGDLTDCLIGDLFRDFKPLFNAVEEFAQLPAPIAHGKPLLQTDKPS